MFKVILAFLIILYIYYMMVAVPRNDRAACDVYAQNATAFGGYADEYTWCMNNRDKWK